MTGKLSPGQKGMFIVAEIVSTETLQARYDEVPYESYPFPKTDPQHLRMVGDLFGLKAPDPARARILELGCAMGGNIIPLALRWPGAELVGVDLSSRQIERARADAAPLNLANLRLEAMSIADVDESFGEFDYIICHGVFSWVPPDIQRCILEISKKRLSPCGIAYVSYNTLPGWNIVRSLREMMLYHTARFETPERKVSEARGLLHFLKDATSGSKDKAYAEIIDRELAELSKKADHYLLHEHLEAFNQQFYFYQFAEMAREHGLQYLGDATVPSMFAGNHKPEIAKKLSAIGESVRTEQYMDFITNRRFRSTLLCHSEVTITRNLKATDVDRFFIRAPIEPKAPVDLSADAKTEFTGPLKFSTHNRIAAAIYLTLSECKGKPVAAEELYRKASRKLKTVSPDQVRTVFHETALRLFLAGAVLLYTEAGDYVTRVSDRPVTCPLARLQAQTSSWVTSRRHESVALDAFQKVLVANLNGENDLTALRDIVLNHIDTGELKLAMKSEDMRNREFLIQEVDRFISRTLKSYADNALLIA
jgi:methyltransferase-like protein/SAM-dependent methyltransferase